MARIRAEAEEAARIEAERMEAARLKAEAEAEEAARVQAEVDATRIKLQAEEATACTRINIDKSPCTYTKASLMKLRVFELKKMCDSCNICTKGLRKEDLIDAYLASKNLNDYEDLIYSKMKITELREECEKKGIDIKGLHKKVDIIGRLECYAACENDYSQVRKTRGKTKSSTRFHALKVVELRAECDFRNLCSSGLKAILIQRLLDHENNMN